MRLSSIAARGALALLFAWSLVVSISCGIGSQVVRAEQGTEPASEEREPETFQPDVVIGLLELVIDADAESAERMLKIFRDKIRSRELAGDRLAAVRPALDKLLTPIRARGAPHPLYWPAVLLAAHWGDAEALERAIELASDRQQPLERRLVALEALATRQHPGAAPAGLAILTEQHASLETQQAALAALGELQQPEIATHLLARLDSLSVQLQPKVFELLAQRASWSRALLAEIQSGRLSSSVLNANQVLRLQQSSDEALRQATREIWGVVRSERNEQREQVIRDVRQKLSRQPGDPHRGWAVFRRVCAQCHRIHGEGQDVGPDLTRNGRSSLEQLLSNVLDPSLVIGAAYQAHIVATADGRILTGLLVEQNEQRVVLKLQGGKLETIVTDEIEQFETSRLSMMPEGLEQQIEPQELIDLFAFLTLDQPPPPQQQQP